MKRNIILVLSAFLLLSACATEEGTLTNEETTASTESRLTETAATPGINFYEGTWASALAKAKEENKLVFLDISASWCGPCKQLKKNTFIDASVGEFYNDKFINVEVDGEVGEGIALAKQYRLQGYPSLYFINSDGIVVQETVGFMPPEQFLAFGKSVEK